MSAVLINPFAFASPVSGGFLPPSVGTVTPFSNSTIAGGQRAYSFEHIHTSGDLLLIAALKGSTDAGPPTFALDEVTFNGSDFVAGEIIRNSSNLFGTAPTVLAFLMEAEAGATADVEFIVTPSAGDIQCIGMVAIDLADADGAGSGEDDDIDNVSATSLSLSATTGQDNSRLFGVTAARGDNNDGTITTPLGFTRHASFGTEFSSTTDIAVAVDSIIVPTAGAQAYATSWANAAAFGGALFEIQGVSA